MKPILLNLFVAAVLPSICNAQFVRPKLVADIHNIPSADGNISSDPRGLSSYRDKLLFVARDDKDTSFWVYDGKNPPVKYSYPGTSMESFSYTQVENHIYFPNHYDFGMGKNNVYRWDGSSVPEFVSNVTPTDARANMAGYSSFTSLNGKVYFAGADNQCKFELFETDPATLTTQRVTSQFSRSSGPYSAASLRNLVGYKDNIYFVAWTPEYGDEVYAYHTVSRTVTPYDIEVGTDGSNPQALTVLNGTLYFIAFTDANGWELYSCDSVSAPKRITDIAPGPLSGLSGLSAVLPGALVYNNGKVYFAGATDGKSYDLWSYNVSTGKTACVADFDNEQLSSPCYLVAYRDKIIFNIPSRKYYFDMPVYIYNTSTHAVNPMPYPYAASSFYAREKYVHDDVLYISGGEDHYGHELYKYDEDDAPEMTDKILLPGWQIHLLPNPADKVVSLHIDLVNKMALTYRVTDVVGREMYHSGDTYAVGHSAAVIDIDSYPQGTYICTVYSNTKPVWTGRFVKL